jgi:hypothetical protein
MADNPSGTSNLSIADATSLLATPPPEAETAEEEAQQEVLFDEDEAPESDEAEKTEVEEADVDEAEDDDATDEEEAEDDYQEQPEMVSVTVDGETYEVTLEEAAKGYQRQAAFTKGMQKNAEDRKALEAERIEAAQQRDAYQQGLQQVLQYLNQTQADPDWDTLRLELPAEEYARRYTDHQRLQERKREIVSENQRIAKEQQAEQQEMMRHHLSQQAELMFDKIPQWRDDNVRQSERQELIEFAKREYGYTQEEIDAASDHRAIKALYDSWQFSKISDQASTAKKKVRKAPKMAKSGSPRSKKEVQASTRRKQREQFNQAPSIANAVDYLLKTQNQ